MSRNSSNSTKSSSYAIGSIRIGTYLSIHSFIPIANCKSIILFPKEKKKKNKADKKLEYKEAEGILPKKQQKEFSGASLVQNHRLCHWILYQDLFSSLKP